MPDPDDRVASLSRALARRTRPWVFGVAVLLALVLAARTWALTPDRELGEYTLTTWEEDLPQNTVLALAQTKNGYLWLGTYEGLARFDGLRFVVFDRRNTPALDGGNEIFDLAVDARDRLWVASSSSLLRLEAGHFQQVLGSDDLGGEPVRAVAAAADAVWASTRDRIFRLQSNDVTRWSIGEGIPHSEIRVLLAEGDGAVWVGFESGELARLPEGGILGASDGLPGGAIRALARGPDGALWIGAMGEGLVRRLDNKVIRFGIENGLPNDKIRCLSVDKHGALWIGTDGGGVSRYFDGRFSALSSTHGMPSDLVRSLLPDREDGLWIGTNGGGVVALQEKAFSSMDRYDGLLHENVRAVLEDGAGTLWIGTDGGGLHRLRNRQLTHFGTESGLTNAFVKSLHEDRKGRLWIGTGAGLYRLDGDRFLSYAAREGRSNETVTVIQDDSEGNLWVGTNGGLRRLGQGPQAESRRDLGLPEVQVNDILESSRGELWVATVTGLYRRTTSGFERFTPEDGLASLQVFALFEDPEGVLWVGTNRGLSRYREDEEGFRTVTSKSGLAEDVIFSILEDTRGRLWMSSNHGVFVTDKDQLSGFFEGHLSTIESTLYGRADGLGADQCNGTSQPASEQSSDGRIWFPTVKGVAVLDPDNLERVSVTQPVVIEEMIVNGEQIPLTEKISLAPGRGERIEFRFTGPSLQSPQRVRFRHLLEDFDLDWVPVGGRRSAHYTKVPPGRYRFRVSAANGDGTWTNQKEDSIEVEIRPFFHQTWWFPPSIGLLLLVLGWSAHRWRIMRVDSQRRTLALLVEARTRELAAANRELERLSVTDSLTGAANRRRLDQRLEEEWMRACRQDEPISLLMIDIDLFKKYNDNQGHQRGDEVLKQVALELQATARRAGDLVARYGGEEFVILVPRMDSGEAEQFAEQVRRRVEGLAIPHPDSTIGDSVTVSVGIATLQPREGSSATELVREADEALYRAKHRGRNQIARLAIAAPSGSPPSPRPG